MEGAVFVAGTALALNWLLRPLLIRSVLRLWFPLELSVRTRECIFSSRENPLVLGKSSSPPGKTVGGKGGEDWNIAEMRRSTDSRSGATYITFSSRDSPNLARIELGALRRATRGSS